MALNYRPVFVQIRRWQVVHYVSFSLLSVPCEILLFVGPQKSSVCNSSEIKLTIDFRSNFIHWVFITWEIQFWNKKGVCPCSLRSSEALFNDYQKKAFPVIVKSLWPRLSRNYSQYIALDTNKHFEFGLYRNLKSWLKFEPNFLTWLPNGKLEKTTVYLLFSLFIHFSAIEIR